MTYISPLLIVLNIFQSLQRQLQARSVQLFCRGINHLLALEPNLQAKLAAHPNRVIQINWAAKTGGLIAFSQGSASLRVTHQLTIEPNTETNIEPNTEPNLTTAATSDVTVSLQQGLLSAEPAERLRFIRIEGDALLTQDLGYLAQHLRWDAEHDLARVIGDAPASLLVAKGKQFAAVFADSVQRLRGNVSEFVVGDSQWLATPAQMQAQQADLTDLKNRIDRLDNTLNAFKPQYPPQYPPQ